MIDIEINQTDGVATLRPVEMVRLTEADFKEVTDRIDGYLKEHDRLQGLVIIADRFPGWDSLKAFASHIKLIKDHHKIISRVAFVSDSPLLTAAPHLVDHFINARVRHFGLSDIDKAKIWVSQDEERSGRFIVMDGYPDNVVAIRAEGTITRDDYEETLIPLIAEKIRTQGQIKLLYWCGKEFEGFTAGAMWDDARFGLMHLGDFLKIAFVTDVEWLRMSMKLFSPLLRMPAQVFHNAEIEDAKQWIVE